MEDTKETRTCPSCETELTGDHLDGLCPRCLLEAGVEDPVTPDPRRFLAPTPSEIDLAFPGLEVLGLLGQGGMGAVYRVRHGKLGRELALKVVPKTAGSDPAFPERGIVHRDVKPENVLLDEAGHVWIADFGLVKLLTDREDLTLTETRQILGTPHYMAPEQIERPGEVDHRVDVYALGILLYEMLTGRLPLGRFPKPSEVSSAPVALDDIVLKALAQDPSERFGGMDEFRAELMSPVQVEPPGQNPVESSRPHRFAFSRTPQRNPEASLRVLLLLCCAGVACLASFLPWVSMSMRGVTGYQNAWETAFLGGIPVWFAILPGVALIVTALGDIGGSWKAGVSAFLAAAGAGFAFSGLVLLVTLLDAPTGMPANLRDSVSGPWPGLGSFVAIAAYGFAIYQTIRMFSTPGTPRVPSQRKRRKPSKKKRAARKAARKASR